MATTVIDTLITKVKFDTDTKGIDKASASIGSFKDKIVGVLGPAIALFTGGLVINQVADAADEMIKFADSTGIAVEALQDLEFATERQGGSIDGLRSSLASLAERIGEAVALGTGEGVEVFEALKISLKGADGAIKSTTDVMFDLNKSFQTLSRAEQISFGTKIGIDPETIRLLQTAPRELGNLIAQSKEFGRITEQEARSAAAFNAELTNLDTAFSRLTQKATLSLLPVLTKIVDGLGEVTEFVKENSQFFEILTKIVIAGAAAWLLFTGRLLKAVLAMKAIGLAALKNPLTLWIIAILAAALVIDDLIVALNGGKSAIDGFLKKFLGVGVVEIIDAVAAAWDSFVDSVVSGVDTMLEFIQPLIDAFKLVGGGLAGSIGVGTVPSSPNPVSVPGKIPFGRPSINLGSVTVNVDAPGGDSVEIAANVGEVIREQFRTAAQDFDSSISR